MALRGNLRDFSLPDVFQLITFSRKTGVLRIRREDGAEGSVWFRDGDVFFAQSNWHHEPLGQRLVAANKITPQALERALEARENEPEGGRRLGQILVDEGYISDKVLEAFVQEQIQDTIFDLMRWDEGDFDFEVLPEAVDEDIGLAVSIENVIMEGSRRLEEWNRIKKKVPSMDVVYKMATAPGEGTFEISLKPIEWNLLLLVDGTRSVAELALQTGRTDFEVARIIYGLFSAGLLELAGDEEVARLRAERAERDARHEALQREIEAAHEAREREDTERRARERAEEAEAAGPPARRRAGRAAERAEQPVEEPEFLAAGGQSEPTAQDVAAFEEMLGLLQVPTAAAPEPAPEAEVEAAPEAEVEAAPEAAPEAIPPEAPPAAEVEVVPEAAPQADVAVVPEEPVASPEGAPRAEVVPEPEVETPAGAAETEIPLQAPPAAEAAGEGIAEPAAEPLPVPFGEVAEPMSEIAPLPEEEPESVLSGDYERDLISLGLGELPTQDLLAPMGAEDVDVEVELEAIAEGEAVEPEAGAEEPAEEQTIAEIEAMAAAGGPEGLVELPAEEPSETEAAEEPAEEALYEEPEPTEPEPDLSALLSSLEAPLEAGEAEEPRIIQTETTFDVGEPGEQPGEGAAAGGVISTDAYLADIGSAGLSLSGGLSDELTALTGGGGGRQRPVANVHRIPEAPKEGAVLHRDQLVDKDLVLRIIEGIKNL